MISFKSSILYFKGLIHRSPSDDAHITALYSEEVISIPVIAEIGRTFEFEVDRHFRADFADKGYIGVTVKSKVLDELRLKYGLGSGLNFRGFIVPLYITIAVVRNFLKTEF